MASPKKSSKYGSGLFSKLLFGWVNPLVYRKTPIEEEDLFPLRYIPNLILVLKKTTTLYTRDFRNTIKGRHICRRLEYFTHWYLERLNFSCILFTRKI